MRSFTFRPEPTPFPRWMGPFSPSRGKYSGFRFHQQRLGTWVGGVPDKTFWPIVGSQGVQDVTALVRNRWGGGRVLFLPNGYVVKPLQEDDEVGQRALIGRFQGSIVLQAGQSAFDLGSPGNLLAGDPWPGPTTTGLECAIQADGSLSCKWYHPTPYGREEVSQLLRGRDRELAAGFGAARPEATGGRVRITANGFVITNRQENGEGWASILVGRIDPGSLSNWDLWIEKEWR